jgi:hypothetical protein
MIFEMLSFGIVITIFLLNTILSPAKKERRRPNDTPIALHNRKHRISGSARRPANAGVRQPSASKVPR